MRIRSNQKGQYTAKVSGSLRDMMAVILKEEGLIDDAREMPNLERVIDLKTEFVIKCGFPPKQLTGDLE